MALHRITATHIIRSPVSGKVMEKIGMKKEEVLREHVIKWDKYEDVVSYGILKKEWETHYQETIKVVWSSSQIF